MKNFFYIKVVVVFSLIFICYPLTASGAITTAQIVFNYPPVDGQNIPYGSAFSVEQPNDGSFCSGKNCVVGMYRDIVLYSVRLPGAKFRYAGRLAEYNTILFYRNQSTRKAEFTSSYGAIYRLDYSISAFGHRFSTESSCKDIYKDNTGNNSTSSNFDCLYAVFSDPRWYINCHQNNNQSFNSNGWDAATVYKNAPSCGFIVMPGFDVIGGKTTNNYVELDNIDIGLQIGFSELNPLDMPSGSYYTTIPVNVGSSGSDLYAAAESNIFTNLGTTDFVLPIKLNITHPLRVSFPQTEVEMVPDVGWAKAINSPSSVSKIAGSAIFKIDSSGPVKATIIHCDALTDKRCSVSSGSGHKVPVDISLDIPGGVILDDSLHSTYKPLKREPLFYQKTVSFSSGSIAAFKGVSGRLDFSVNSNHAQDVVKNEGQHYSGVMTIAFETAIN